MSDVKKYMNASEWEANRFKREQDDRNRALEQRGDALKGNRYTAIAGAANSIAASLGDPAAIRSDAEADAIAGGQALTSGLSSGVSIGVALASTGIGVGVGLLVTGISLLSSSAKRSRMKEEFRRKWKAGEEEYKRKIASTKAGLRKLELRVRKAIGTGEAYDIQAQAQKDAAGLTALARAERGGKNISASEARKDIAGDIYGLVESASAKLVERTDLLMEGQELLQQEIDAKRQVGGAYATESAKKATDVIRRYEEV